MIIAIIAFVAVATFIVRPVLTILRRRAAKRHEAQMESIAAYLVVRHGFDYDRTLDIVQSTSLRK